MTRPANDRPGLSVTDLFANYLQKQINAHAAGLGQPEPFGDAEPHEAVPVQPVDPALAWKDAVAAARLLIGDSVELDVPPEWPPLVARQEPAVALAFALGNFPQLVRNLHPLLSGVPMALRDGPREAVPLPGLIEWSQGASSDAEKLLAAGVLRLARQFDAAAKVLDFAPPPALAELHRNEQAALAWHRGDAEKALALWQSQPDNAVSQFNSGMALVFLGRNDEAVAALSAAVGLLPETSAWHHLGQLYLALARGR
jgi:tetratricopeptide (TPR) repeat protein